MNRYYWPLALTIVLLYSTNASALEFNCKVVGDERFLRVEIPGQQHLCEVSVTNLSGERRVMWYANQDTQFCTSKAYELRDKYISQWQFVCETWPDLDGIDLLSRRHRVILDTELKRMIEEGKASNPPFTIESVRATASDDTNGAASTLALQYFLSTGDVTQVIVDDGQAWTVTANINELAQQVKSDVKITAALVESISDTGALQIMTVVDNNTANNNCFGSQVLIAENAGQLAARTPHRYVCEP